MMKFRITLALAIVHYIVFVAHSIVEKEPQYGWILLVNVYITLAVIAKHEERYHDN